MEDGGGEGRKITHGIFGTISGAYCIPMLVAFYAVKLVKVTD